MGLKQISESQIRETCNPLLLLRKQKESAVNPSAAALTSLLIPDSSGAGILASIQLRDASVYEPHLLSYSRDTHLLPSCRPPCYWPLGIAKNDFPHFFETPRLLDKAIFLSTLLDLVITKTTYFYCRKFEKNEQKYVEIKKKITPMITVRRVSISAGV